MLRWQWTRAAAEADLYDRALRLHLTEDFEESARSFVEKRQPVYRGRVAALDALPPLTEVVDEHRYSLWRERLKHTPHWPLASHQTRRLRRPRQALR